jgi:DnaJ family protein C protein 9
MHLIEEAFGKNCDLYKDVLQCPRDGDLACLRKAYYRRALQYHPDKKAKTDSPLLFQAISLAYQLLKEKDTRAAYDETGEIGEPNDDDDTTSGSSQWKAYFDQIFGKVTASDIDAFAAKYKCSDEERRDVLKEFQARKGNLIKMLDFVMLSEPRDAVRWLEDYLRPALEDTDGGGELKDVPKSFRETMEKTATVLQKKIQTATTEGEQEETDTEETESDEDDDLPPVVVAAPNPKNNKKNLKNKKLPSKSPVKAKPTKVKKQRDNNNMTDLIAQIQNKNRGSAVLANLGARYGVDMKEDEDKDPMDEEEFAKIQGRLGKKKKASSSRRGG